MNKKLECDRDGYMFEVGGGRFFDGVADLLRCHNTLVDRVNELEADLRTRPLELRRERDEAVTALEACREDRNAFLLDVRNADAVAVRRQAEAQDLREKLREAEADRDGWRDKANDLRDSKQALNDSKQKEIGRLFRDVSDLKATAKLTQAEADKWRAEAEDLREKLNRVRQALEAGQ